MQRFVSRLAEGLRGVYRFYSLKIAGNIHVDRHIHSIFQLGKVEAW